jgi:hypothetical protein
MERAVFSALFDGGREVLWAALTSERDSLREAWSREREAWSREREAWSREREAWSREREVSSRERSLLLDREASSIADLQREVDFANGLMNVRSVLESIVTTAFPSKSVTDSLRVFCDDPSFQQYLVAVSKKTKFSQASLIKSAKGAYSMLSETIHAGSTHAEDAASAVPQAVLRDKCTLCAVAAVFKFARRDVRFYVGGAAGELKLPTPEHSTAPSAAGSDAGSPPKPSAATADAARAGIAEGTTAAAPAADSTADGCE